MTKTSNLDYSAYLSCMGCKLVDIEISAKGIAYWIYETNDVDHWMAFLKGGTVSAVRYSEALRACKRQAFEGRGTTPVVHRRSRGK